MLIADSSSHTCGKPLVGSSFFVHQDKNERIISTITLPIAMALNSSAFSDIEEFAKYADCNEYTMFTHRNFFYSYPECGKKWTNGKDCEFHRVNVKCHLCGYTPERNYSGVGIMFLLNNGYGDEDILVVKSWQKKRGVLIPIKERIANTPSLSRMIILCQNHVAGYFKWRQNKEVKKVKPMQLELF